MRVTTTKSKNAESFYITQSYTNSDGKSTSKIVRKLGTLQDLCEKLGTDRDGVMAWAFSLWRQISWKDQFLWNVTTVLRHICSFASSHLCNVINLSFRYASGGKPFWKKAWRKTLWCSLSNLKLMTLSCREEVKLIVRRRLPLTIQLDGTWERQHAARRLVEGRINVERGEDYC